MKKSTKIWLVIAASLVFLGLMIFAGVMLKLQWDFTQLRTREFEINTHEITGEFHNISVNTDTADLNFVLSHDGTCRVECYEEETAKHSVFVEGDTLVIRLIDSSDWYDHIGISFGSPRITVYLPKAEYTGLAIREHTGNILLPGDFHFESIDIRATTGHVDCFATASGSIRITADTGDIRVENIVAEELELSVSTGSITVSQAICEGDIRIQVSTGKAGLSHIVCKNLTSDGNTGDIALNHVVADEKISIQRSTGDVTFDSSDAGEIWIKTDTGDISGSLLSPKVFLIETDTGSVDVPKSTAGGTCEITSNTGDIQLRIP